jgi:hypothetical protein
MTQGGERAAATRTSSELVSPDVCLTVEPAPDAGDSVDQLIEPPLACPAGAPEKARGPPQSERAQLTISPAGRAHPATTPRFYFIHLICRDFRKINGRTKNFRQMYI